MMPLSLTLMRHAESESNLAHNLAEEGTPHPNEAELMKVHTSDRRLTKTGASQAMLAGAWLREHWFLKQPNATQEASYRLYVSPYARTVESAGYLGFGREWRFDNRLVERNWGSMDSLTFEQRMRQFGKAADYEPEQAFYWRPSDGETLQDVFNRLRDMTSTLHCECEDKHVLIVTHGETIWAWRTLLEYWSSHDLTNAMRMRTNKTRHVNCRIIQYSRFRASGEDAQKLCRVRFVHPEMPDDPEWNTDWYDVERPTYSHTELQKYVERFPKLLEEG